MLRAKEAEGVHVVARPCPETAHPGSVWHTGKSPSLLFCSPPPSSGVMPLKSLSVPSQFLQSKPGLEGLLEMAFDNQGHYRVSTLCHVL